MKFIHLLIFSTIWIFVCSGNLPPQWDHDGNMNYERIREDTEIGKVVYTLHGTDEEGSQCVYGIRENGRPYFNVNPVTGEVTLARTLDREEISQHHLTVSVSDGVNFVYDELTILVEDANDNAPVFEGLPYSCEIPETTPRDTRIFQVSAHDPDLGPGGSVNYEIELLDSDRDKFSIDPNNGWISLIKDGVLTADEYPVHAIKVQAKDRGGMLHGEFIEQSTTATLAVNVISVKPQQMTVKENKPLGTLVGIVDRVYSPGTESMMYFIIGENDTFTLNEKSRTLVTNNILDREKQSTYHLFIKAVPEDEVFNNNEFLEYNSSDSTQKMISVLVEDENDNPPRFTQSVYFASILIDGENNFNDTVVQVAVNDEDLYDSATQDFSITSVEFLSNETDHMVHDRKMKKLFSIDATDGIIHVHDILDNSFQFGYFMIEVRVDDHTTGWYDTCIVQVNALRKEQRVKIIFRGQTEKIEAKLEQFLDLLSNVLEAEVNVDDIRVHRSKNGKADDTKTDMWIHVVDPESHNIMDTEDVISIIDSNDEAIQSLLMDYNVISVEKSDALSYKELVNKIDEHFYKAGMIATIPTAMIIIFVLSGLLYCVRKRYRMKLRAANAVNYADNTQVDGSFKKSSEILGTNKYSTRGGTYQPLYEDSYFQPTEVDKGCVETVEFFTSTGKHESSNPDAISCTSRDPTSRSSVLDNQITRKHSIDNYGTLRSQLDKFDEHSVQSGSSTPCYSYFMNANDNNRTEVVAQPMAKSKGALSSASLLKYRSKNARMNSYWWVSKLLRRKQLKNAYHELKDMESSDFVYKSANSTLPNENSRSNCVYLNPNIVLRSNFNKTKSLEKGNNNSPPINEDNSIYDKRREDSLRLSSPSYTVTKDGMKYGLSTGKSSAKQHSLTKRKHLKEYKRKTNRSSRILGMRKRKKGEDTPQLLNMCYYSHRSNPVWNLSDEILTDLPISASQEEQTADADFDCNEKHPDIKLDEEYSQEVAESLYSRITDMQDFNTLCTSSTFLEGDFPISSSPKPNHKHSKKRIRKPIARSRGEPADTVTKVEVHIKQEVQKTHNADVKLPMDGLHSDGLHGHEAIGMCENIEETVQ